MKTRHPLELPKDVKYFILVEGDIDDGHVYIGSTEDNKRLNMSMSDFKTLISTFITWAEKHE